MLRFNPDLAATFVPGFSTVPAAEVVMFLTFMSSMAMRLNLRAMSVVIR